MSRVPLKIYRGPDLGAANTLPKPEMVTVSAAEIVPLLAEAHASRRTWLNDFADDPIEITADLYEVLMAYRHFRRKAA